MFNSYSVCSFLKYNYSHNHYSKHSPPELLWWTFNWLGNEEKKNPKLSDCQPVSDSIRSVSPTAGKPGWAGGLGGHQVGRGHHTVPCHRAVTVNGADMGDMLIHLASNSARRPLRSSVSAQKKYTHSISHTGTDTHARTHTPIHPGQVASPSKDKHSLQSKEATGAARENPHGMGRTFKAPEPGIKPTTFLIRGGAANHKT